MDVSEDNVVILLKKETAADKLAHQWQKFFVGLNASQTTVSDAAPPVASCIIVLLVLLFDTIGETVSDNFQC